MVEAVIAVCLELPTSRVLVHSRMLGWVLNGSRLPMRGFRVSVTGWAKNLDHYFLKFITPTYDDVERRSIYVQYFTWSKSF